MKKFFKTSGFILLYLAIYFILQLVYLIGAMVVSMVSTMSNNPDIDQSALINHTVTRINNHILPAIIVAAIISFGIYYLICRGRKTTIFKVCEFNRISLQKVALMIPAAISLGFVVGFLISKVYSLGILDEAFSTHQDLMGDIMGGSTIMTFLAVGLMGPFIEEVIFRGLIYKELRGSLSIIPALIIQAVLFGLYHMQVIQAIYSVFIGIAFGLVFIWFKSIWAPVILHVVYNSTFVVLSRIPEGSFIDQYPNLVFIINLVILITSFIFLYKERIVEVEDAEEPTITNDNILEV